jgi:uncharacterized membrane protein (UPF0127 family)
VLTALVIFIITYVLIGLRQIPQVHIDRPAGALVGAALMVVFGVLTLDQAFSAVDLHTLLLLLGMMIITVYLRVAGFFELMADKILSRSRTPLQLLIFISLSAGLLSALFVNDTICLLYTPIVLAITVQLGVNPMPYLLALATASNIVAQQARKRIEIGFMEYFRAGALITALTIAAGILVLAIEVKIAQGAEIPAAAPREKKMTVTVVPSNPAAARRTFRVVLLCDTMQLRTRGLQGFRTLQADEAAFFVFDKQEEVTFWMGSVSYAIDIIFVGPDHKVVRTYANCRPGSRDLYPSGQAIKWVIETAAGSGIKAGDRVSINADFGLRNAE